MEYQNTTKDQLLGHIGELQQKVEKLNELESECRELYEKSNKQSQELAILNKDINQRKKDLEVLNTIISAVHESLDIEKVYKTALDVLVTLENIDMAFIYLLSGDKTEAVLQSHMNAPEDYIRRAGRIPYPKGVTWKVIKSGQVVNIEDIQKDKDICQAGKDMGHHRALGIPIILEDEVLGVIWLCSYQKGKFSKHEVDFHSSIGDQIGIAIAKAKLYRELSTKNSYEKAISRIAQSVHQSIGLQEVIENAVESMSQNIELADIVSICLTDGKDAVIKASRGCPDWFQEKMKRIQYPKGFTWACINKGEVIFCLDAESDSVIGPAGKEVGTRSYLAMPLKDRGETIGCINVHSLYKNAFDKDDIGFLEVVGKQIEIAINKSRDAEALRSSEERYRTLYEENPSMCFTVNEDGNVLSVNRNGIEKLGYTAEELIGHSVVSVFHEEDKAKIKEQLSGCFVNPERIFKWELRKVCKNGSVIWVSELARCINDTGGNKVALIACMDITERKRAEEAKREAEERYRTIVENTYNLIIEIDVHGNISYANPYHKDVLGYDPQEMIGMNCLDLVYEDDCKDLAAAFQKAASTGESVQTAFYRCKRKDRELRWLESTGRVYRDTKGGIRGVISSRDITDRKTAEEALRDSEERHRALIENSYDLIIEISHDFKFLYISPNHKTLLGYEQEELIGKSIFDNIHPDNLQEVLSKFQRVALNIINLLGLNTDEIIEDTIFRNVSSQEARALWGNKEGAIEKYLETEHSLVYRYKTKNGEWIWLESTGRPFWTSSGELRIALSSRDISESKNAQESIKEKLDQLSKKNSYESIIREVTEKVHQSLNPIDVFKTSVESMIDNIQVVQSIAVFLVEEDEVVLKAHSGLPDWLVKRINRFPKPESAFWRAITQGEYIYVENLDAEEDTVIGPAASELGINSSLSVPITNQGKTVGIIHINSFKKNAFDEEDIWLLKIVAHQFETSINNEYQRSAILKAQEELEERVEERTSKLLKANTLLKREINERKSTEKQLIQSREQIRNLAVHLQSIREEETTRLARVIHDDLGQLLTGLKIEISLLDKKLFLAGNRIQPNLAAHIKSISELIDTSIHRVQELSTELRPAVLDRLGLIEAIIWQLKQFESKTGIHTVVDIDTNDMAFGQERSTAIFRIFQESLTNIARHAGATRIRIKLKIVKGNLVMDIKDNGIGIRESSLNNPESNGIRGMKERVLVLGGELQIKGIPKKGTIISVVLPL